MPAIWTWLIITAVPVALLELLLLRRQTRALLSQAPPGPPVSPLVREDVPAEQDRALAVEPRSPPERCSLVAPNGAPAPASAPEALLCFDPAGQCTAANLAARRLLRRGREEICLSTLLPGGSTAASTLLSSLAAEGVIERDTALSTPPTDTAVHLKALALRDRDNNFWGVALFIRPAPTGPHQSASEPPSP